jgi:hypothetical protein
MNCYFPLCTLPYVEVSCACLELSTGGSWVARPMEATRSENPHSWKPLNELDQTRILTLAAGQGSDPLSCNLHEISLDHVQEDYIAISYAWGGTDLEQTITCDGQSVAITSNLHGALHRLRQQSSDVKVWCDALCIKQGYDSASLLERSHQISLMSRIFALAKCVDIDLGNDDGTCEQAADGMRTVLAVPQELREKLDLSIDVIEHLDLPQWTDPMWTALHKLFSRPYYHRLWCVQEVVMAREVSVIFGGFELNLQDFMLVARIYQLVSYYEGSEDQSLIYDMYDFNRATRAVSCLGSTCEKRTSRLAADGNETLGSLCQLLCSTMYLQCTDLRDKIYALYGMVASEELVRELPVSYQESAEALSLRTSRYFLKSGNASWTLVYSGGIGVGRPSWTLDLANLGIKEQIDPLTRTTNPDGTNDAYSAGGTESPSMTTDENGTRLTILGTIVDTFAAMPDQFAVNLPTAAIAGVGSVLIKSSAEYTLRHLAALLAATPWIEAHGGDTRPPPDALWRTLIADFSPYEDNPHRQENGRALPGFGQYFHELIAWAEEIVNSDPPFNVDDESHENMMKLNVPFDANKFWSAITPAYLGRRMSMLRSGTLALVPHGSVMTDVIAVFRGVPVPFVLRSIPEDEHVFEVVGICYVHGIMDGEALDNDRQMQEIVLV